LGKYKDRRTCLVKDGKYLYFEMEKPLPLLSRLKVRKQLKAQRVYG